MGYIGHFGYRGYMGYMGVWSQARGHAAGREEHIAEQQAPRDVVKMAW
jgi:hypothetical protein